MTAGATAKTGAPVQGAFRKLFCKVFRKLFQGSTALGKRGCADARFGHATFGHASVGHACNCTLFHHRFIDFSSSIHRFL